MSERDGFEPGVPCWVAAVHPDPERAVGFYTELFGWEAESVMPPDSPGSYFVCRLRGRDVAAVVSQHGAPPPPTPVWATHVWVESADETAAKVAAAGGSVLGEPFDSPGGGRVAVVSDPAGPVFCLWEPGERRGAQLVNEPGAWSMSLLSTPDPEGAKAFYGAVFGWTTDTFEFGDVEATLWRVPGFVGGEPGQPVSRETVGVMMAAAEGSEPGWGVDFWVRDADATAERALELGGRVETAPYDAPGFRQAVLADAQGAVFSVSQLKPPG